MDTSIEYQDIDRWLATSPPMPIDDDEPRPEPAPEPEPGLPLAPTGD